MRTYEHNFFFDMVSLHAHIELSPLCLHEQTVEQLRRDASIGQNSPQENRQKT